MGLGAGILTFECCAKPETGPFTFAALGATFAVNGVVILLGIAREIIARSRQAHIRANRDLMVAL